MQRFTFSLHTAESVAAFETALQWARQLTDAGWSITSVTEGYLGGLAAGEFVLGLDERRETVPFRLDPASLAAFRATLKALEELPTGRWILGTVELDATTDPAAAVLVMVAPTAPAKRSRKTARGRRGPSRARSQATFESLRGEMARQPTAYDLGDAAALDALRRGTGPEAEQVRALLGDEYFQLLGGMARAVPEKRGARPKALVLPGIMGSKLGTTKKVFGLVPYDDVIWLDPLDMRFGRLDELALGAKGEPRHGTRSLGVLYTFYLRLKLALDLGGFDAEFYHYDWRRPVRALGQEFCRFLDQQKEPVVVVAHSMGGIVTRAALKAGAKNVKRVIMIGTPNHGSFAPAQALRGAYSFLKSLAITFEKDLITTTDEVFTTFAGLYDLLPVTAKFPAFPLFEAAQWPKTAPRIRADLLKASSRIHDILHTPDEQDDRYRLICGVNQETIVGARVEDGEFVFLQTKDGDGTVPRISAELPNTPTVYVDGSHGMLPNYGIVCDLAVDLARDGVTTRPTLNWHPPTDAPRELRESALRIVAREIPGLRRGGEPGPAAVRQMLSPWMALPPVEKSMSTGSAAAAPTPAVTVTAGMSVPREPLFGHELKGVVLSRRRQRQLEVALFPGSLTQVSTRAYVLGLFQGVAPAGAALAVDGLMGGIICDFVRRRMLSASLAEVFIVPKGRSFIPADHVIFVGLGPFDRFRIPTEPGSAEGDTMRLVCESVVRTCLHANIEEFATVLLGVSAAERTSDAVELFARSFLDALNAIDLQHRLRKITLCETDPVRVTEIRTHLLRLATTELFNDVELELRDLPRPPAPVAIPASPEPARAAVGRRSTPLYLLARMLEPAAAEPSPDTPRAKGKPRAVELPGAPTNIILETSLLMPRSKAAVLTTRREIPPAEKTRLLAPIQGNGFSMRHLDELGRGLVEFVFGDALRGSFERLAETVKDLPLVVVHDAVASQLPWETLRFGDWVPALAGGVTRQHLEANLSVAKWLEQRLEGPLLDVLLVSNPTGDLEGAEEEANAIRAVLNKVPNTRVTERHRSQATRQQLLADFRSGQFDVIHYAGHAFFDPAHPGRAGVICTGNEVLSGADLAGLSGLPSLVFFNACESGRIRGRKLSEMAATKTGARKRGQENISLANAFIRGGVATFVGTYWPVGDFAASKFGETFYPLLVEGASVGDAVLAGRRAVQQSGSVDWADYLLYGSPDFVLKRRG